VAACKYTNSEKIQFSKKIVFAYGKDYRLRQVFAYGKDYRLRQVFAYGKDYRLRQVFAYGKDYRLRQVFVYNTLSSTGLTRYITINYANQ
jgi:hypothetical protein